MDIAIEAQVQPKVPCSDVKVVSHLSNMVAICRTCPREKPGSGGIGHAIYSEIKDPLTCNGVTVMMVHCLGSCRTPCAVALDSPVKPRVRLSGLNAVNAGDLVEAALNYRHATSEDVSVSMLPGALRRYVTAISPKRL